VTSSPDSTPVPWTIRPLRRKDAPSCCRIIDAARQLVCDKNTPEGLWAELSAHVCLVCERAGHVVGLGCLAGDELRRVYVWTLAVRARASGAPSWPIWSDVHGPVALGGCVSSPRHPQCPFGRRWDSKRSGPSVSFTARPNSASSTGKRRCAETPLREKVQRHLGALDQRLWLGYHAAKCADSCPRRETKTWSS
jgi:hypothetical protein